MSNVVNIPLDDPSIGVINQVWVCSDPYQINLPDRIKKSMMTEIGRRFVQLVSENPDTRYMVLKYIEERVSKETGIPPKTETRWAFQVSMFYTTVKVG